MTSRVRSRSHASAFWKHTTSRDKSDFSFIIISQLRRPIKFKNIQVCYFVHSWYGPSEETGLWQLRKVSSVFKFHSIFWQPMIVMPCLYECWFITMWNVSKFCYVLYLSVSTFRQLLCCGFWSRWSWSVGSTFCQSTLPTGNSDRLCWDQGIASSVKV